MNKKKTWNITKLTILDMIYLQSKNFVWPANMGSVTQTEYTIKDKDGNIIEPPDENIYPRTPNIPTSI